MQLGILMKNNNINTNSQDSKYYNEILDFVANNDLTVSENYEYICDKIDIQSYIDYFCFQVYTANCDSIANNFARWRCINTSDKPYEDGKWRWLLYDTDDSAGMVTFLSSYNVDSFVGGHWSMNALGENGDLLFSSLIKNEDFKQRFIDTFINMAHNDFDYKRVHSILYEMARLYEKPVVKSQKRFLGSYIIPQYDDQMHNQEYTKENFWNDISVIDSFYKKRGDYIIDCMYKDFNNLM